MTKNSSKISSKKTTTSTLPANASTAKASKGKVLQPIEGDLLEAETADDDIDLLDTEEDHFDLDENAFLGDLTTDLTTDLIAPLALPLLEKGGPLALVPHNPPEKIRDSLHLYLREISKFPILQPEEELELARSVKATGNPDAAFRLISSHLRLVVRIAMDFQRRWMHNVLDLIQEGNVGLVKAVDKFDPEKGIKFSYYASFWIKAYVLKFIMDNWRMVKVGTTQNQRKLFYNLNKERQYLVSQGFDPTTSSLAERLNVSEDQVIEMEQRLDTSDMSLDTPMNEDGTSGATKVDYLPSLSPGIEEVLGNSEVSDIVQESLKTLKPLLSDKERYILEHRLLTDEPTTLREIGEEFAITRERVRQIEARLLQKVREHLFKHIKDFSHDWIQ